MAAYSIEITRTATRQIDGLPLADRRAVVSAIQALARDPHPPGCRKLQGHDEVFRIRVRRYRVIYAVEDVRLVVVVLKVGHRKDVYRGL